MTLGRALLAPAVAVALLALPSAPATSAEDDLLQLKDGQVVDGVPMKLDTGAVVLTYKNGDVRVPMDLVEDYVIGGAAPEPVTDEAKAQRANGQVFYHGKWMTPVARDKAVKAEIKKRQDEIADAKAHSEWRNRYQFESKYFRFESTLSQQQNENYSALLDAYFEVFKKEWGLTIPKEFAKKLRVCIYPTAEEFQKRSGAPPYAAAYYKFVADSNSERELNFYNDRGDSRMTETCMFHECCHYVQDLYSDGTFDWPHLLGESLAEYYGGSVWDPKTKTLAVGQIQEGRLAAIKSDIEGGKKRSLTAMLSESSKGNFEDYTWGWSFAHFLMQTPAYAKKFKQFFNDLARAPDVKRKLGNFGLKTVDDEEYLRVFKKRMGLTDAASFDKLEAEWYAYIDKLQAPGARGYELAGMLACRTGEWRFKAPRLLRQAISMGSRNPQTYLWLSRALRRNMKPENFTEALDVITKACEIDPVNADVWAERGFVLQLMGRKDEGKKLVDLAYELDPGGYFVDIQTLVVQAGDK